MYSFFRLWATLNLLFIDFYLLFDLIGHKKNNNDDDDKKGGER